MIKIKKYQIEDYISDATQNALDLKADLVDGKVPSSQLPSYVDDVIEVANYAALPIPGETGVIYITLDTNKVYRWTGSVYVEIASGSTNLSYTPGVSNGTVNSDTGSDAVIPLAGLVNAGLFSAEEKSKLDGLELQNLQEVVNIGNSISNYGGIGNASIQSTNFSSNRTLYLNNNSHPTIKLEDNLNGNHYTVIDIDTLNLNGVSYPWSSIVEGSQNLQEVTDEGSVTTNSITANSFIKSGGTGTNILLDNGLTVALSSVVGNTNLSTSQTATNFTINSDTGTDASVPLGNGTLAGATLNDYTTAEKNKLAAITGTNTGNQNLQSVTDLGAVTNNTMIITGIINDYGLIVETSSNVSSSLYVDNDSSGINSNGIEVNSFEGVGAKIYSSTGIPIVVFGNGNNTASVEVNLGNTNKGIEINSGTSSTGNFIELAKNGINKLTVNQAGELTAQKLIKDGGTSSQFLKADGSVDSTSYTTAQNLQQVTNLGATTTNTIIANVAGANPALTGYSITGNGVYGQSDGKGVFGYSFFDAAVYGYAESVTGIAIKGYAESGVAAEFETDAFSANIVNFKKSGVLKAFINNAGELTAEKLIKSGGTSSQILAADGSVITAGTNITITGGQISSVGGSGGGGSSVNYYLNGGTSQGTFGGTTYYEFSKTAVIGTGADFSRGTNGYIASFITDVADPSLLLIPAGNWNLEFFFNASSNGGSPSFYVELYKYDGTTFTLIASNSATPEGITGGASIDAYFTPLAVPETVLTVNDRLAIRVFVNASSKTITLHTQNGHLCEVITTFTSGLTALNGLQAQVQNFATGTTGTDFAINSSGSTHTFNLPSASATARGVVTTTSQTFAGDKTFTGAIVASNLSGTNTGDQNLSGYAPLASPTFTGTPLAPTPTSGDNSTKLATTAFVTTADNLKQDKSLSAYKFTANNTNETANGTEQVYKDIVQQSLSNTSIVWTGTTAPSGTNNHSYKWSQVGKLVTLRVNLVYTVAAFAVTTVSIPFDNMSDLPVPATVTGFTANGDTFCFGVGLINTAKGAPAFTSIGVGISAIRKNTTGTGTVPYDLLIIRNIVNALVGTAYIQYYTT